MRLRRLNLDRYGMFKDRVIDFGEKTSNTPDLHIIYGPNESGKTTAANAFLDLLFGIQHLTKYNFRHRKNMGVSAELEVEGELKAFSRKRGRKNTLLDSFGAPVADDEFSSLLHDLQRDSWQTMFSLSEATLESGAEEILAARGELGRLFFQGAAGLVGIDSRLSELKEQADEFYAVGSRRQTRLRKIKSEISELETEARELDTPGREYSSLRERFVEAQEREADAKRRFEELDQRQSELDRIRSAMRTMKDLHELRRRLNELPDFGDLPAEWHGSIRNLAKELDAAASKCIAARDRIERLDRELNKVLTDDAVLGSDLRMDELDIAASRWRTAADDLPKRLPEKRELDFKLQQTLENLGLDRDSDPERYALAPPDLEVIDKYASEALRLMREIESAASENSKAEKTLRQLEEDARSIMTETADSTGELEAAVQEARRSQTEAKLEAEEKSIADAQSRLKSSLARLRPWTGDEEKLVRVSVPSADLAKRWTADFEKIETDRRAAETELRRLEKERAGIAAEKERMTSLGGLISDEEAANLRKARDDAWSRHYESLDLVTADAFKSAMDTDYRARDDRAGKADEIVELRKNDVQIAKLDAEIKSLRTQIASFEEKDAELRSKIKPCMADAGLPEDFNPSGLTEWLPLHEQAMNSVQELRKRETDHSNLKKGADRQRDELVHSLKSASVPVPESEASLALLLQIAERAVRQAGERRVKSQEMEKSLRQARRDLADRKEALETAQASLQELNSGWASNCPSDWLKGIEPKRLRTMLAHIRDIRELIQRRESIEHRIDSMEKDQDEFKRAMEDVARKLGEEPSADPLEHFKRIRKRKTDAEEANIRSAELARELRIERDALETAEEALEKEKSKVREMAARLSLPAGLDGVEEVTDALASAKQRADLAAQVNARGQDLAHQLKVQSVQEAEALLEETNPENVESDYVECQTERKTADEEFRSAIEARSRAERDLDAVGSDDRVVKVRQRIQTALAEAEDGAERALRLRLGLLTAERALKHYRDEHRNSMLRHTERNFVAITGGAYSELSAESSDGTEFMTAYRPSDSLSCQVEDLSKGTRFQLYFSLRMAAYTNFCEKIGPLPFVADDIMESFDDERAKEAFALMAEISANGQMIYFTHHQHVLGIAESACGESVRIHRMPAEAD